MELLLALLAICDGGRGIHRPSHIPSERQLCRVFISSLLLAWTSRRKPSTIWDALVPMWRHHNVALLFQFNLVCNRAWMIATASSVYFVGFMAVFPLGMVSDRYVIQCSAFKCGHFSHNYSQKTRQGELWCVFCGTSTWLIFCLSSCNHL